MVVPSEYILLSSYSLTTVTGRGSVPGVTSVRFYSLRMAIGRLMLHDVGLKMVLCPCLCVDGDLSCYLVCGGILVRLCIHCVRHMKLFLS